MNRIINYCNKIKCVKLSAWCATASGILFLIAIVLQAMNMFNINHTQITYMILTLISALVFLLSSKVLTHFDK